MPGNIIATRSGTPARTKLRTPVRLRKIRAESPFSSTKFGCGAGLGPGVSAIFDAFAVAKETQGQAGHFSSRMAF